MDKTTSGQLDLFAPSSSSNIAAFESTRDSFGCCSRYHECSDAGICLIPEQDYSINCIYRKTLESGTAYYGKNSAGFSSSDYAEICQRIGSLSPAARTACDALVIDFCEYHRGANHLVVRNEHVPKLSAVGLFQFERLGAEFTRLCDYQSFLLPELKNAPVFKAAQAKRKAERKFILDSVEAARLRNDAAEAMRLQKALDGLPSEGTMDFMRWWLDHEGISIRDIWADPYRTVSVLPGAAPYLYEIYREFNMAGFDSRIYPTSPLAADRLLSVYNREEDELRRVKLSRGYSAEEKARRIEAIQGARSERKSGKAQGNSADNGQVPGEARKRQVSGGKEKPHNPLDGKMCVISGTLAIPRSEAFLHILKCGGKISDTPVNTMDILILGRQEWSESNGGIASRKVQKAAELCTYKNVLIVSEDEFSIMLRDAYSSV